MASVCIICKENKNGIPVKDDAVISSIRWVKRKLGISTNNVLVVCNGCEPVHREKRSGFERRLLTYGVVGGVLAFILMLLSRSLAGILLSLLLALFIISLSIFHYQPATEK